MFNIEYKLIDSASLFGVDYDIDLSFDNVIRVLNMLNDDELDGAIRVNTALEMLFNSCLICDIKTQEEILTATLEGVLEKNEQSKRYDLAGNPMPTEKGKDEKLYCLTQDAQYIYASFLQDYNIDLIEQQGKLHWHKFTALLSSLSDNTKLMHVIDIRASEIPKGKGTEKEAKRLKELKEKYKLKS